MQTEPLPAFPLGKLSKPLLTLLAVMSGLTAVMYFQRFVGMAQTWRADDNYSHGFFIPLLAAYFVWDKWDRLLKTPVVRPAWAVWAGSFLIAFSLLAHLVGVVGTEPRLSDLSFISCLYGLVLTFLGPKVFRQLLFPIFFLALMIPPPGKLLQDDHRAHAELREPRQRHDP